MTPRLEMLETNWFASRYFLPPSFFSVSVQFFQLQKVSPYPNLYSDRALLPIGQDHLCDHASPNRIRMKTPKNSENRSWCLIESSPRADSAQVAPVRFSNDHRRPKFDRDVDSIWTSRPFFFAFDGHHSDVLSFPKLPNQTDMQDCLGVAQRVVRKCSVFYCRSSKPLSNMGFTGFLNQPTTGFCRHRVSEKF